MLQLFALRASSCCKHDMVALSWLNAETLKKTPTALLGRLIRCSTHGHSLVRIQYNNITHQVLYSLVPGEVSSEPVTVMVVVSVSPPTVVGQ